MVGLPNPLAKVLHPHRQSSKTPNKEKPDADADGEAEGDVDEDENDQDNNDVLPPVSSQTSSACEIFNLFKFMAAGKGNQKSLSEEVDSDESEGEDEPKRKPKGEKVRSRSNSKAEEEDLRHSGSRSNMQIGGALHDDDDSDDDDETLGGEPGHEEEKKAAELEQGQEWDALREWQKTHGQNTADLDAQGQRLAGETVPPFLLSLG
jgi:nucleolin